MLQEITNPLSIFGMTLDSILWLRGQVPNEGNDFGVSYDVDEKRSIVPFVPYKFKLNLTGGKDCNYFIDWIEEGGLERIDRFSYNKNLPPIVRNGDHIELVLKPINNLFVRNDEKVCIPSEYILSMALVN